MPNKVLNILTVFPKISEPPGKELINRIASVSQMVRVKDVSGLLAGEKENDASAGQRLDELLVEADIIFGLTLPRNIITRAPRLKWIHMGMAGVEAVLTPEIVDSKVVMTNARGINAASAAELVLALMLMQVKRADFFMENQRKKAFQNYKPMLLEEKTVGILGLGSIGSEVARLAKAFKMKVVATRSNSNRGSKYADEIFPPEGLKEVLARSDFVVVALPCTSENKNLIGDVELRAMKPTSYLINIARGAIIDEEALTRALVEGWIAGAGLDVFNVEPLPAESRLWDLPNVTITPHLAGRLQGYKELSVNLFCDNLNRFIGNKKLLNIVDKQKGY